MFSTLYLSGERERYALWVWIAVPKRTVVTFHHYTLLSSIYVKKDIRAGRGVRSSLVSLPSLSCSDRFHTVLQYIIINNFFLSFDSLKPRYTHSSLVLRHEQSWKTYQSCHRHYPILIDHHQKSSAYNQTQPTSRIWAFSPTAAHYPLSLLHSPQN